jgi:AcrR family transcriptional regulator
VPTGVALQDARRQLFDAAERVLLRDGPGALTSRAVTTEAGVAKGVLHRHFADFDEFLADLVLDRIADLDQQAMVLFEAAGTSTVADNLTDALVILFGPITVGIVALIIARDELRTRLLEAGTGRVPLLGEGTAMVRAYLLAEQNLGRLARDIDIRTLAPTLIGAVHLLCTDQQTAPPDRSEVRKIVIAVVPGTA